MFLCFFFTFIIIIDIIIIVIVLLLWSLLSLSLLSLIIYFSLSYQKSIKENNLIFPIILKFLRIYGDQCLWRFEEQSRSSR